MQGDWATESKDVVLRVDGGMTASDWTMQFIADILGAPVDRPRMTETTALGAAWRAGHEAGVWPNAEKFANSWALETRFMPGMERADADKRCEGWKQAVKRTLVE
jgi:glycerol kinase